MLPQLKLIADFPNIVLMEWCADGKSVNPSTLGISTEVIGMLDNWYRTWTQIWAIDKGDKPAEQLDWKLLDEQGLEIWKRLRSELAGRYEVLFYSHALNDTFEDPSRLEPLLRAAPSS